MTEKRRMRQGPTRVIFPATVNAAPAYYIHFLRPWRVLYKGRGTREEIKRTALAYVQRRPGYFIIKRV